MRNQLVKIFYILCFLAFCLCLSACVSAPTNKVPEVTVPAGTELEVTTPDGTEPEVTTPDGTEPEVTIPDESNDLVYDMTNYQWFSDIFEERPVEEWNSMGRYTMHLGGLHAPVEVNLDGTSVLSVSAFDQTVELGTDGLADEYHDGYSPVQSIRSTQDAVVIHVSFGEMGDGSILITKNQIFKYPKETDSSIFLWVEDDGTLGYRQTWVDCGDIEEEGFYALERLTDRDQVLYQNGNAKIVEGELVLTAEEAVVLSDLFDLDTMFSEAKAAGRFEEYETVDELFEANKIGV